MKKIKKLTALLLTLVMSLALAVPCFAAEPQEASRENAAHLKVGETVTVNGLTATLEKGNAAATLSAARTVYTPITSTKTWTYEREFGDSATCRSLYGDMLSFTIVNDGANDLTMEVWVNRNGVRPERVEGNFYCEMNDEGPYTLTIKDAFRYGDTADAEWSVLPTNTGRVNLPISAYQYWSFDV